MEDAKIIKAIEHYQKNVERYLAKCENAKILHCIQRLCSLPIDVDHLQKTGVGRTVNGLRKLGGETGEAAKSLVTKWKDMVAQDGDENEAQEKQNSSHSSEDYSENDSQSSRCEQDEDDSRRHEKEKSRKHDKKRHEDKTRDDGKRRKDDKEESKRRELEELKRREEKEESRRREEKEEMKRKEEKEQRRKEEKDEKRRRDEKEESRRKTEDSSKNASKRKRDDDMNGHGKQKKSSDESKTSKSSSSSSSSKHKKSSEESNHKSKDEKKRKSSSSEKKEKESSSSNTTSSGNSSGVKKKKVAVDDGIDCESGTSFEDALMMHSPSVKVSSGSSSSSRKSSSYVATKSSIVVQKSTSRIGLESAAPSIAFPIAPLPEKLETQDISIATMLPSITTNYKPMGNTFRELDLNSKAKKVQDDEALSRLMYAKNQRTKVYSGNKVAFSKMPTLFELCTRVLQDNIEALEYTGGVPYAILKPVLDKATPEQLYNLEYHNPYIVDDSDELWSFHCQKEFRTKKRLEMETCREMYMRCLNERETKLKALTANIKLSQDKSVPVRQTKLAYVDSVVKPPRNVAKKQAKNGVDNNKKPMITPSSRLNAIATAGAAGQVSVPNHVTERSSSSASSSYSKPQKKAPLMAKTLQLMKGRFRR
ncbi:PREDICTED: transcription elongation factor B polypeptide 3-like [Nicrophorus vespilloides]|uniref:Transcription elongation factor B polypeptide 3-like n=1 Tax=Nicrophorus vespilloides TaxID=110193 RepID=A0ABM1MJQ0_NICVS|nr:PREDICTED: transcription elongation factor B polypeptide 3-like [Nicrophorus vespilloides]